MGSNAASSGGGASGSTGSISGGNTKTRFGYSKPKSTVSKVVKFVTGGGITGAIIRGAAGAIKTANIKSKQNKMDYEGQAYGVTKVRSPNNFTLDRGNNNNSNIAVPLTTATTNAISTAPTTAEVSQSAATDVSSTEPIDNILSKKKKTKAIGRSMTILTSSTGVKSDDKLTLGKKSLLGA
jgi:hypothetical protein